MAKFQLNQKETLAIHCVSEPVLESNKKTRIYVIISVLLAVLGGFFIYAAVSNSEPIYYVLAAVSLLSAIGFLIYYLAIRQQNAKLKGQYHYYITNIRLVIADGNEMVLKELLLSKIKRIDIEKNGRNSGTVYINRKIDDSAKARLKQRQTNMPVYTNDTFVLSNIRHLNQAVDFLQQNLKR